MASVTCYFGWCGSRYSCGDIFESFFLEGRTETERKDRILKAIRTELEINQHDLLGYGEELEQAEGETFFLSLLRVETWRTFSDGGELEWIKDPDLLNNLADVYFSLKHINFLSEKLFEEIQTWNLSRHINVRNAIKILKYSLGDEIAETQRKIEDILKLI